MHEDVENKKIPLTTMPSGFRGYHHIMTEHNGVGLLSNISSFDSINNNVFNEGVSQCPLPMTIQLKTQLNDTFSPLIDDLESALTSIENPTWGINTKFNYRYRKNDGNEIQLDFINRPSSENQSHYENSRSVTNKSIKTFDFSMFYSINFLKHNF